MDLETVIDYDEDFKVDNDFDKPLCRCCLSSTNRLLDAKKFSQYFMDLAAIDVVSSDSLPPYVCKECLYLLFKAVRFKHKMMRAQTLLYEYISRCTPFPMAGSDPELNKLASPNLQASLTLTFSTDPSTKYEGYHAVLQHETPTPIQTNIQTSLQCGIEVEVSRNNVKMEFHEHPPSDFEDDIPLQDYKSTATQILSAIMDTDIKTESEDSVRKKKRKEPKMKKRKKKKEHKIVEEEELEKEQEEPPTKLMRIRKPIEIDPNKIKTITLNAEEQLKAKQELSKANVKFPYQCHLCYKGFNFEHKLQNHMKKHSPSRGSFSCQLCSMYFPTQYSYLAHSLAHTTKYECRVCARVMTDRASIYNHYRSQHEGITTIITCVICGKMSSNEKTHRGHMRNHHSGVRPECDLCGKSFVNKDALSEHLQIHEGVKNYECSVCGKRCRTRAQITTHQLKHRDDRQFYCVECDVRFKTSHTFRQHLIKSLKHRDVDSLKHACDRCPKRFATAPALSAHVSVAHLGLRPHPCALCGAALASLGALRKHVASVHDGKRRAPKHVCDACGKAFTSKSSLTNHLRTHTGEKPYKCDICGRAFTQRTAMRTHLKRVHKTAKPKQEPVQEERAPGALYGAGKLPAWHPPDDLYYVTAGP